LFGSFNTIFTAEIAEFAEEWKLPAASCRESSILKLVLFILIAR